MELNRGLASAKSEARKAVLQRQIDATEVEIDRLVDDLYGFTTEEIAMVEEDDSKGQLEPPRRVLRELPGTAQRGIL